MNNNNYVKVNERFSSKWLFFAGLQERLREVCDGFIKPPFKSISTPWSPTILVGHPLLYCNYTTNLRMLIVMRFLCFRALTSTSYSRNASLLCLRTCNCSDCTSSTRTNWMKQLQIRSDPHTQPIKGALLPRALQHCGTSFNRIFLFLSAYEIVRISLYMYF